MDVKECGMLHKIVHMHVYSLMKEQNRTSDTDQQLNKYQCILDYSETFLLLLLT